MLLCPCSVSNAYSFVTLPSIAKSPVHFWEKHPNQKAETNSQLLSEGECVNPAVALARSTPETSLTDPPSV